MINTADIQAGEIWDDGSGYTFALHFIERVSPTGAWVELLHTPNRWPATKLRDAVTYYSKHLGHGSFIPFTSNFWTEKRWTKHGSLPSLIGNKSVKIAA